MKKLFAAVFLTMLLAGCSHDDGVTPIETNQMDCKVLKYQQFIILDSILYRKALVYESGKIVQRLNYGDNTSGSAGLGGWGLISTDHIFYNSDNTVSKIEYSPNRFDLFYYTNGNYYPIKRAFITISDDGYVSKYSENISYDETGRILKTFYYNDDPNYPYLNETTTDYTYDSSSNLAKTVEVYQTRSMTKTTTVTYSNYDAHKNPFRNINVPFIENRHVQFSKNNYKKISSVTTYQNDETSFYEVENGAFTYNEFDYPIIAEYNCH